MTGSKQVKRSVALAVAGRDDPSMLLLVRRPDEDVDFPGAWGLPAASCSQGETREDAARRIGPQKLGAGVNLGPLLASGRQERARYVLEMFLYAATLDRDLPSLPESGHGQPAVTLYAGWRWGRPMELEASARRGSLCSRLLLDSLGPA